MNVTVEILRWRDGSSPEVLQTLSHICHSLGAVRAAVQRVIASPEVPGNGYRITTDIGIQLYGWSDGIESSRLIPR
jgi:DNA-binding winged helix-turn-helix (wHTH) protein